MGFAKASHGYQAFAIIYQGILLWIWLWIWIWLDFVLDFWSLIAFTALRALWEVLGGSRWDS